MEYLSADAKILLNDVLSSWKNPISYIFLVDLVATAAFFTLSLITQNSSVYDPAWSIFPVLNALIFVGASRGSPFMFLTKPNELYLSLNSREFLLLLLVSFYGIRLTVSWYRRLGHTLLFPKKSTSQEIHEDWRYTEIRTKPRKYLNNTLSELIWWGFSSPILIHLYPTLCTALGSVPMYFVLSVPQDQPFNYMDLLAGAVMLTGILLEMFADLQMDAFLRSDDAKKGKVCRVGLWSYSRHPNYLGEQIFWLSMVIFAYSAKGLTVPGSVLLSSIGFLQIVLLFATASIPWMEKRQLSRRPDYKKYQKEVPILIPFLKC